MQRRHQVFISSTFLDLQEERSEVTQALLELDCMPAGMELFPAANEEQWDFIKKVIDESDYYIVIVGARYGSISPQSDLSYTEMEYDYALSKGIPTIGFIRTGLDDVAVSKTEMDPERRTKLDAFRAKVESRLCKQWQSAPELGGVVSRSIVQLRSRHERPGWIRADSEEFISQSEALRLRKRIDDLEEELQDLNARTVDFEPAAGHEVYAVSFYGDIHRPTVDAYGRQRRGTPSRFVGKIDVTWDEVFASLSSGLLSDPSAHHARQRLQQQLERAVNRRGGILPSDHEFLEIGNSRGLRVFSDTWERILIHFRGCGLLDVNAKGITLTAKGDRRLTSLLTVPAKGAVRP